MKTLAPKEREYTVWDAEAPGFGVRVRPSGAKRFVFAYRPGGGRTGRMRWVTIGAPGPMAVEEARKIARDHYEAARKGLDPAGKRDAHRAAPSMDALFEAFLERGSLHTRSERSERTTAEYRRMIAKDLSPALGRMKVADIRRDDVEKLHRRMRDRPFLANRALSLLRAVFRMAEVLEWRPQSSNPAQLITPYRESKRRDTHRFGAPEMAAFGRALSVLEAEGANAHAVLALRIAALRGLRIGEIRELAWDQIDLERRRAFVTGKTGRREIALPSALVALLEQAPRRGPYVVPGRDGEAPLDYKAIQKVMKRAAIRAGLPDLRIHDLRHFAAFSGAGLGANAVLLRDFMGHRGVAMTAEYVSEIDDPLEELTERIGSATAALLAGGSDDGEGADEQDRGHG